MSEEHKVSLSALSDVLQQTSGCAAIGKDVLSNDQLTNFSEQTKGVFACK